MKAYQVFEGDFNKHGHQVWSLNSTYLSKERSLEVAREIVNKFPVEGNGILSDSGWSGCYQRWDINDAFDGFGICKVLEIEITE